jgi:hypothetical protein
MTGVPDATQGYVYHDETLELIAFVRSRGIPFVGLSRALGEAAAGGAAIHFENDLHWDPGGHQIAGRVLSEFFTADAGTDPEL